MFGMDRYYGLPELRAFADAMFDHALHRGVPLTSLEAQIAQSVGRAVDGLRVSLGCAPRGMDERNVRVVDEPWFFERFDMTAFARGPIAYVPRSDLRTFAQNLAHECCHAGSYQSRQSCFGRSVHAEATLPRNQVRDRRIGTRLTGIGRRGADAVAFDMLNEALTECAALLVRRTVVRDIGDPTLSRRCAMAYAPYRSLVERLCGVTGIDDPEYASKVAPALRDYFAGTTDWLRALATRNRRAMRIWRDATSDDLRSAVLLATAYGFPVTILRS